MFVQSLAERGYGLGVAAEPYRVPASDPKWFADSRASIAIVWGRGGSSECSPPATKLGDGRGFVVVRWGTTVVVGVYLPPSWELRRVEDSLEELGGWVRRFPDRPVLLAGDFNAHSALWGSRADNARGRVVADWAATLGLLVQNRGASSTLVRWQGESVVDITLANPVAARGIGGWRVLSEVETLSDHLYIEMVVGARGPPPATRGEARPEKR